MPTQLSTPKSWPDDSWPTAAQLADWLGRCTDEERLAFAAGALSDAQLIRHAVIVGEL